MLVKVLLILALIKDVVKAMVNVQRVNVVVNTAGVVKVNPTVVMVVNLNLVYASKRVKTILMVTLPFGDVVKTLAHVVKVIVVVSGVGVVRVKAIVTRI